MREIATRTVDFFFYLYDAPFARAFLLCAPKEFQAGAASHRTKASRQGGWHRRLRKWMVRKHHFPPAGCNGSELIPPHQFLKIAEAIAVRQQVIPLRRFPPLLELLIVNENLKRARRVRSILQIEIPPIQDEGIAVRIKR